MPTPNANLVVTAIGLLQAAKSASDIADAAAALAAGMGLDRYTIIDVRGNLIAGLHHNAPTALEQQVSGLEWLGDDPIATRLRASPVPFLWEEQDAGQWRCRHGGLGYRSGVAAASWGSYGNGCLMMLSGAEPQLPREHLKTFLAYSLTAAAVVNIPLKQLAARPQAPCPLSERELECLQYAAAGKSSKETARALGIGLRTVGQYLERARAKLQAKTSLAAATTAIRRGWLDVKEALDLAA